jgi:putative ABC transport system permease protein
MQEVEDIEVASGRFFFSDEEESGKRVMVLGATRAQDFFPRGDAVGSEVKLGDLTFKVVGVLEARGATAFSSPDDLIYIPLGTAQRELLGIRYLNFARSKVDDAANIEITIKNIDDVLRKRHDIKDDEEPDYSIRNTQAALGILTQITDILRYFLLLIASVSLLVGGVGIMNSMLIAVSQRVWEIGLRKAVGANRWHILKQFLTESIAITSIGGFFGIVIGIALTYMVALIVRALGYEWEFIVSLNSVLIGALVSVAVGLIFGVYPALKASRVSPLEALRYE